MTLEETKKIFHWFTDFVLNPQNTNPINGVTVDKINYLENAIGGWAYVQNLLIENNIINYNFLQNNKIILPIIISCKITTK